MTVRAITGLVLLNAFLLVVGAFVVHAVRGWRSWGEAARLGGLAYLAGVAACGSLWVLELVAAVPFTLATVLLTGAVVSAASALAARRLGRTLPAAPALRLPRLAWTHAVFAAAAAVFFEALFRSGRLRALTEYDAWAFWVPKAKAIYFFHGLDHHFFSTLPGPSYPPLLPALEAVSFQFMGSADAVTLHLQLWFLLAGFAWAVAGLLAPRVPAFLLWPPLLLVLVAPQVRDRALQPQADLLLDELVGVAALLVALWLLERRTWQLVLASVLLSGAMLTKREGFLLTAGVVVAAGLASARDARRAWPRLAAAGVGAFVVSIPWRIWFEAKGLPSDAPEAGGLGLFHHLDRAWPSLRLTVRVLFEYGDWLLVAPLAVLAVAAALLAGRVALGVYGALVLVFGVLGFSWVTWSFPSLPITAEPALNPIVRSVGAIVLAAAALVPLLLGAAWRRGPS